MSMDLFRKAYLASVALAVGAGPGLASEQKSDAYAWSGFDVGVQGGYGGSVEQDNLSVADFEIPVSFFPADQNVGGIVAHGAIGGAHIGYDQQFGSLVFGVRAELDATGLRQATSNVTKFSLNGGSNCQLGCLEYDTSATFRDSRQAFLLGRGGYALDRLMVYAEAGLAISNQGLDVQALQLEVSGNPLRPPTLIGAWSGAGAHDLAGGAFGLGAQYALTDHWQLGAEWRFADFAPVGENADLTYSRNIYDHAVAYRAGFLENFGLLNAGYRF